MQQVQLRRRVAVIVMVGAWIVACGGAAPSQPPADPPPADPPSAPLAPPVPPTEVLPIDGLPITHGGWGAIDREGRILIAPRHAAVSDFEGGIGTMVPEGQLQRRVFVGLDGAVLHRPDGTPEVSGLGPRLFNDGRVLIRTPADRFYYLDRSLHDPVGRRFDYAQGFSEGLAWVREGGASSMGVIDVDGGVVCPARWHLAWPFSEGLAAVMRERGGLYQYIDRTCREVTEPRFHQAEPFSEGVAAVMAADGTWGMIDRRGAWAVEPRFEDLGSMSEGLAPARSASTDRWGYIDADGQWAIEPRFAQAEPFSEGLATVELRREPLEGAVIDRQGHVVIGPAPLHYGAFEDGLAWVVAADGAMGYVRADGSWLWEPTR